MVVEYKFRITNLFEKLQNNNQQQKRIDQLIEIE